MDMLSTYMYIRNAFTDRNVTIEPKISLLNVQHWPLFLAWCAGGLVALAWLAKLFPLTGNSIMVPL